jgi:hypothetical protein
MQQLLTDRLVTITFSPLDEVAAWCGQVGLEARRTADGSVIICNPHFNFTTAIYDGLDPISRGVCLASAVAGPSFWPEIFPRLLDAVNKEWKERARNEKTRQKWEKSEASVSKMPDSGAVRQPTFETLYKRA